jgi:hypothetical protein
MTEHNSDRLIGRIIREQKCFAKKVSDWCETRKPKIMSKGEGKKWQPTPNKNLPRMQYARAIPVT